MSDPNVLALQALLSDRLGCPGAVLQVQFRGPDLVMRARFPRIRMNDEALGPQLTVERMIVAALVMLQGDLLREIEQGVRDMRVLAFSECIAREMRWPIEYESPTVADLEDAARAVAAAHP